MSTKPDQTTLCIDLGGTNIRLAPVNQEYKILSIEKYSTREFTGPEQILGLITDNIKKLQDKGISIRNIAIAAPGPLNSNTGIVEFMPNLPGWRKYPLISNLEERAGMKAVLINDADAAAAGEYIAGVVQNEKLFALLTLGTGLGSSVMIDGKPWTGSAGISPEFGHLPIFSNENHCGCGHSDHVESRLSTRGLWRRYYQAVAPGEEGTLKIRPVEELFRAEENGDKNAESVISAYAEDLGKVISAVVIAYSLKIVVLNGGISLAWNRLKKQALRAIEEYGFSPLTDDISIRPGDLGDSAALIGAASVILNRGK